MSGYETALTSELPYDLEPNELHDECGVFGIWAPQEPIVEMTVVGLQGLQHRGQSAAGVMYGDPEYGVRGHTGLGLVKDALKEAFVGTQVSYPMALGPDTVAAVGHVRYSTASSDSVEAAQPFKGERSDIAVAHNGNVPQVEDAAVIFGIDVSSGVTDSHKMAILIDVVADKLGGVEAALQTILPFVDGAYCFSITDGRELFGARDPWGIHPLAVGQLVDGKGYVLASESVVFPSVGAELIHDVEPGEIVALGPEGMRFSRIERQEEPRRCSFEWDYTSRPDSVIDGVPVYDVRHRKGEYLAAAVQRKGLQADIVVGMPDSAIPASYGFAEASGVPLKYGMYKNPYSGGRSFLARGKDRDTILVDKARPIASQLKDKRVFMVEDSMIKGNSNRANVQRFRDAGATEVHVVIATAPYKYECFMGMDTGNSDELVAARMTNEEMRIHIGADSLTFLTPDEEQAAFDEVAAQYGQKLGKLCMACSTGEYPFPLPAKNRKVGLGMPAVGRLVALPIAGA